MMIRPRMLVTPEWAALERGVPARGEPLAPPATSWARLQRSSKSVQMQRLA